VVLARSSGVGGGGVAPYPPCNLIINISASTFQIDFKFVVHICPHGATPNAKYEHCIFIFVDFKAKKRIFASCRKSCHMLTPYILNLLLQFNYWMEDHQTIDFGRGYMGIHIHESTYMK